MDALKTFLVPLWRAETLTECLTLMRLNRLPKTRGEQLLDVMYFSIMGLFVLRTGVPLLGVPFLEKMLCFSYSFPQAYIVLQICVSLAYSEIMVGRCWFYYQSTKPGALDFLTILDDLNPVYQKWFTRAVKFFGCNLALTGTTLLVGMIQWLARHTEAGDYVAYTFLLIWFIAHVISVRHNIWDMIVIMAAAIGAGTVLYLQMCEFIASLDREVSMRRLLRTYNNLIHRIHMARPLIAIISTLNQMIVIPFCGTVLSLAFYKADNLEAMFVAWILMLSGAGYAVRGYLFTGYCSLLYGKSLHLHNRLASLIARKRFCVSDRKILLTIITDLASDLSHLIFVDENDGKINQLDLLHSLMDTLEFFILSIQFRGKFF